MVMGATRARMLVPLLLGAMLPLSVLAQASGDVVVVSDTQTQWLNEDTNLWQPAVITTLQSPLWPQIDGAEWIWNYPIATPDQKENGDVVQFRRTFTLPAALDGTGTFLVTADNEVTATLNGQEIITTICDFNHSATCLQDIPITGQAGENIFEFTVTQYGRAGSSSTPNRNLAGLVYQATFATPAAPEPIVLVPALTASFNPATILADRDSDQWDFAPFANLFYQGLLDRLAQQGFIENQNLFIAHYDWRNPVADAAANYLQPVIDHAKQATGASKVDIVAHSMGGLVARAYIQSDNYGEDVDQLIMLGTPNLGAADAYVAWEGGVMPERWSSGLRLYLVGVENSLRTVRVAPLPRPLSFRAFFPSLKDLLPTEQFVVRNNTALPITDMAEQNLFLNVLKETQARLAQHGIRVTTFAGSEVTTLGHIPVSGERSLLDVILSRWRDGQPIPNPPQADSNQGDQTVLLSSAHLGITNVTIPNAEHDNLPELGQEGTLLALGLDASGAHIHYDKPDSLVGIVVLSPVTVTVTDTNGHDFFCDTTKESGNFSCVVDETDPNGPKLLVMTDPDEGQYGVTLTGTGDGEYHAITCYADEDEDACTTRAGQTSAGHVDAYAIGITPDSYEAPVGDIVALICALPDAVPPELHGRAVSLCQHATKWQQEDTRRGRDAKQTVHWRTKLQQDFARFSTELDGHIEQGNLDGTAAQQLIDLHDMIVL